MQKKEIKNIIRTALSGKGKTSYLARVLSSLRPRRPCVNPGPVIVMMLMNVD